MRRFLFGLLIFVPACFILIVGMTLTYSVCAGQSSQSQTQRRQRARTGDRIEACVICQNATEEKLVSPATADWPFDACRSVTHLGDGEWKMQSHVDSQNRMGALIRIAVDCTAKFAGQGKYLIEDLQLLER